MCQESQMQSVENIGECIVKYIFNGNAADRDSISIRFIPLGLTQVEYEILYLLKRLFRNCIRMNS